MGINWGSSLEVAFRSLSWLWGRNLLAQNQSPALPDSLDRGLIVIPNLGSVLSADMPEVVRDAEVVIVATKVEKEELAKLLTPGQTVIDLVNLDPARRQQAASYQGICW